MNFELVDAFLDSSLSRDPKFYLVLVGEPADGAYKTKILQRVEKSGVKDRVRITGWAEADLFSAYLQAADIGVQLRTKSRGETSGTVLDCMAHAIPVIVNANGSLADLDRSAVYMMEDSFGQEDLIHALEKLATDQTERVRLGARAQSVIQERHDPKVCAKAYYHAIESAYQKPKALLQHLVDCLSQDVLAETQQVQLANALSISFPEQPKRRTIFVDVSEYAKDDAQTGIQRVVRSVLVGLFAQSGRDFDIVPVRRNDEGHYVIAVQVAQIVLGVNLPLDRERYIAPNFGDVFLGLDLDPHCPSASCAEIGQMRRLGTKIFTIVYDLLPVQMPELFLSGADVDFSIWLERISGYDGAICISRAVADDLQGWMSRHVTRKTPFQIGWFHLGADVENSVPSTGLPSDAASTLELLRQAPTFLMVGTIEPRKGHRQVLDAFDAIWAKGQGLNLVIVGKEGWGMDDLIERIRQHPQLGKRLFWQNGISDAYLEQIYSVSSCLIAASEGEGFGLPLIEAAQHNLPILARNLPVFQEVAGQHASYFNGLSPHDLVLAIEDWLRNWNAGCHPKSDDMPRQTWAQSSKQLYDVIEGWMRDADV